MSSFDAVQFARDLQGAESLAELIAIWLRELNAKGLEIQRFNLGMRTLHPQIASQIFLWNAKDEAATNLNVNTIDNSESHYHGFKIINRGFPLSDLNSKELQSSPIPKILRELVTFHFYLPDFSTDYPFPILKDLAERKMTGYLALPILEQNRSQVFVSFANSKPNGIDPNERALIEETAMLFGLIWNSAAKVEMFTRLMQLYLGPITAGNLLAGQVERGDVRELEAVLWFSDIRDYTGLTLNHPPEDVIAWLNEYYDLQINLIHRAGGEVLKLMGDGLLAVFPLRSQIDFTPVKEKVMTAVRLSHKLMERGNRTRVANGLPRIEHGIGLHVGKVQYGNIGARDRLDFTVIGSDVNLTSRIAAMCAQLQEKAVFSNAFTDGFPEKFTSLNKHKLKGVPQETELFKR